MNQIQNTNKEKSNSIPVTSTNNNLIPIVTKQAATVSEQTLPFKIVYKTIDEKDKRSNVKLSQKAESLLLKSLLAENDSEFSNIFSELKDELEAIGKHINFSIVLNSSNASSDINNSNIVYSENVSLSEAKFSVLTTLKDVELGDDYGAFFVLFFNQASSIESDKPLPEVLEKMQAKNLTKADFESFDLSDKIELNQNTIKFLKELFYLSPDSDIKDSFKDYNEFKNYLVSLKNKKFSSQKWASIFSTFFVNPKSLGNKHIQDLNKSIQLKAYVYAYIKFKLDKYKKEITNLENELPSIMSLKIGTLFSQKDLEDLHPSNLEDKPISKLFNKIYTPKQLYIFENLKEKVKKLINDLQTFKQQLNSSSLSDKQLEKIFIFLNNHPELYPFNDKENRNTKSLVLRKRLLKEIVKVSSLSQQKKDKLYKQINNGEIKNLNVLYNKGITKKDVVSVFLNILNEITKKRLNELNKFIEILDKKISEIKAKKKAEINKQNHTQHTFEQVYDRKSQADQVIITLLFKQGFETKIRQIQNISEKVQKNKSKEKKDLNYFFAQLMYDYLVKNA